MSGRLVRRPGLDLRGIGPPADLGEPIVSLPRGEFAEVRVGRFADPERGELVILRRWQRGEDGRWWPNGPSIRLDRAEWRAVAPAVGSDPRSPIPDSDGLIGHENAETPGSKKFFGRFLGRVVRTGAYARLVQSFTYDA